MNVTLKSSMTKLPNHCKECKLAIEVELAVVCTEDLYVTTNWVNRTLHPYCPIERPAPKDKQKCDIKGCENDSFQHLGLNGPKYCFDHRKGRR